jgi:Glycerol-3-phosphate dehydrogenase
LLQIESNLQTAVLAAPILLIVVPSHAFASILTQIKPFLRQDSKIVWATKKLNLSYVKIAKLFGQLKGLKLILAGCYKM